MISLQRIGHSQIMSEATLLVGDVAYSLPEGPLASAPVEQRFATLVDNYYDYVWRAVRRLGVANADTEDATLRVFEIASRKLDAIRQGCEGAFLFQAAVRVAADYRRASRRRRDSDFSPLIDAADASDPTPLSDELLELRRAREQLDQILDAMPFEHRMVFVLHELEQTPMSEIATLAGVPQGTVASRLRRARQFFRQSVERLVKGSPLGGQEP